MTTPVTDVVRRIAQDDLPKLRAQLIPLESREKRTGERQLGNLWRDTTAETITEVRRQIETLEGLVAALGVTAPEGRAAR